MTIDIFNGEGHSGKNTKTLAFCLAVNDKNTMGDKPRSSVTSSNGGKGAGLPARARRANNQNSITSLSK